MSILTSFKHAWNAFFNRDPTTNHRGYRTESHTSRPDRVRLSFGNDTSIVAPIYNRIAIDVSSIDIRHVRLDENGKYVEIISSQLNDCLTLDSNQDQTIRALMIDAVMSLCDEGCIAIVPVETTADPLPSGSYDISSLRVGKILEWYAKDVKLSIFNEDLNKKEEIILPKKMVAIIENPLYTVMNEYNSTVQRLVTKLNQLDVIDDQSSSGKLDLIVNLPYVIKSPAMRERADSRRADIESQLTGSKYGIAYIDGTEKITQLNRPVQNNLMASVEYLTNMLYNQLGMSKAVIEGTADEKEMLNYFNRTIEPILSAIIDEMKRKFLTKTARTQGQSISYFRDPFKLVPVTELANIGDKFTRNEILSSNEMRAIVGYKPSKDPKADELRNKNLNPKISEPGTENDKKPIKEEEQNDKKSEKK